METNKISRRIFSFFGILGIAVMVYSCEPSRKAADMEAEPISESITPGTETAEALDRRIVDLNQTFSNVEREVMASERVTEEDFREKWRNLEVKRHDLNRNIELYNQAIEKDASLEAAEYRTEVNRLITEIERDLREVRDGTGAGDTEFQEPQEFEE
ncbi:MAG: hypothetical protein M3Q58_06725 [Bacteroidota bacterium]|nr:hypothetical protein [Bacteroidota bacterium]